MSETATSSRPAPSINEPITECGTGLRPPVPTREAQPGSESSEPKRSVDALVGDSLRYRNSAQYRELLEFIRVFPACAPFNGLLVHVQKPGSTYVATAGRWHDRWQRRIKIGAQQLVILQTFGPVLLVVDVSDTEPLANARPLPLEITDPFAVLTTAGPARLEAAFAQTISNAKRDGVRVHDVAFGAQLAGRIRTASAGVSQAVEARRRPEVTYVQVPVRFELEINARQDGFTRYGTLCHELAHLYCGHLGTPSKKWWPDRQHLDHRTVDFEAESAAAIAVWKLDPTATMPPYLSQHLARDKQVPDGMSLDRVLQVAGLIADMARKRLPLRRRLYAADQRAG